MNQSFKSLGVLFALLFTALFGLSATAHAQITYQHITAEQVSLEANSFESSGRVMPDAIQAAYALGEGVTIYSNGDYTLDDSTSGNAVIQGQTYDDVFAATGDAGLATEAALGLLTADELQAIYDKLYGQGDGGFGVHGSGGWFFPLSWYSGPFSFFGNPGGQGGNGGGYEY